MPTTLFCPKCDFLIQPIDGGRFPPWCPHCGEDLKRGAKQGASAIASALPTTRAQTASEIAAAFLRRRPAAAPAPQPCEAIKPAAPVPQLPPQEEPAEPPRPPRPLEPPPPRGQTFADEEHRLDAALPLWCRLLRILFG
jgi:hypothetical protein